MSEPLRVLVTSSRTWSDAGFIWSVLDAVFEPLDAMELVHGAARDGGDYFADQWAIRRIAEGATGLTVRRRPANWARYGKRAGRVRNEAMVDEGVDLCLAFACQCAGFDCRRKGPHFTHGTDHCANYAESSGVETRVFSWESRADGQERVMT